MKVKVFKDCEEKGWFKDHISGANAVIAHCKYQNDDITKFVFKHYDTNEVVWVGKNEMLELDKQLPPVA